MVVDDAWFGLSQYIGFGNGSEFKSVFKTSAKVDWKLQNPFLATLKHSVKLRESTKCYKIS